MVKGRKKPIYDSDDGVFDVYDDALISHDEPNPYDGPRDQTGIIPKDARKWTTGTNLESATRDMSRVGQGGKTASLFELR